MESLRIIMKIGKDIRTEYNQVIGKAAYHLISFCKVLIPENRENPSGK